jgi:hypothetical protein
MANSSIKRNSKKNKRVRTAKKRYVHLPVVSLEQSSDNSNELYSNEDAQVKGDKEENLDNEDNEDYPIVSRVDNQDHIVDQISSFSEEEKEDMFSYLEEQIENKKKLLMSKRNYINKYETENPYLTEVKTQYEEIYNALLNEKRKEFIALNSLQEYLLYLINNNIVIDKEIVSVRKEQQHILEEMQRLRAQAHYAW